MTFGNLRAFPAALVFAAALAILISVPARSQPDAAAPAFEAAEIHPSPRHSYAVVTGGKLVDGLYTLHQAPMVDLIAIAYDVDDTTVIGGPSWLETDRFEIAAKASPHTSKAILRAMLRSLLAERFHLVVHKGAAPLPAYVLAAGAKPRLKPGDGDSICQDRTPPASPGFVPNITVECHNVTMDYFVGQLQQMASSYVLEKPIINSTALDGSYDFDLTFTNRAQLDRSVPPITIFEALQKQLGLKLSLETAPRPAILVDSVSETPTPNRADIAGIIPPPAPLEFEAALLKPARPGTQRDGRIRPNQINFTAITVKELIQLAWDLNTQDPQDLVGPRWLESDRYDLLAKAPVPLMDAPNSYVDSYPIRDMLRALLIDRFHIQAHIEDRRLPAWVLTAPNPRLKLAQPGTRTRCFEGPGHDGKDPRLANPALNRLLTCQNSTMSFFADKLQDVASSDINGKILNETALTPGYDFTISFTSTSRIAAPAPGGEPSDPNGGISLFDALPRQLGLKLEKLRRPVSVLVIDHIDEKPTEN